jgi:hypothetical protein
MRSRLMTVLLVLGLVVFAATAAYATSAHLGLAKKHHHGKKHHSKRHHNHAVTHNTNGQSSAQSQYGTRPGKGCGDRNHTHTGPPGNPSNTSCPQQSQHSASSSTRKHGHRHGRRHGGKKHHGKH